MDAKEICRMVTIRDALKLAGARLRSSKRADCPLCKGTSKGTIAFTERLWHCHRCAAGGDVFSLVQAVNNCGFREALQFVANWAGVTITQANDEINRRLASQGRQRERTRRTAMKLAVAERTLRFRCRSQIHWIERIRLRVSERLCELHGGAPERFVHEVDALWAILESASRQSRRLQTTYALLAFGFQRERARFVLQPADRENLIDHALDQGFIGTDDGRMVEVTW